VDDDMNCQAQCDQVDPIEIGTSRCWNRSSTAHEAGVVSFRELQRQAQYQRDRTPLQPEIEAAADVAPSSAANSATNLVHVAAAALLSTADAANTAIVQLFSDIAEQLTRRPSAKQQRKAWKVQQGLPLQQLQQNEQQQALGAAAQARLAQACQQLIEAATFIQDRTRACPSSS